MKKLSLFRKREIMFLFFVFIGVISSIFGRNVFESAVIYILMTIVGFLHGIFYILLTKENKE